MTPPPQPQAEIDDNAPARTASIAVGLIVADDGRLLLQHRDDKPGIFDPGRWGCFGGHVDAGERPQEAFLREMHEELGWRPAHFELFTTRTVLSGGWRLSSHVFAAHLDVPLDRLTLGEGQAMALFAPDALPSELIPDLAPLISDFTSSDAYKRVKRRWDIITATAILVDADGCFLLQHRDDKPNIDNPGMWGSFGGRIEPYETPDEGFLRELQEELSWQPRSFELHASAPYHPDDRRQLIYIYAAPVEVPLSSLTLGEGQNFGFFAPDDLPTPASGWSGNTQPDYRDLLARFARSEMYADIRARAGHALRGPTAAV